MGGLADVRAPTRTWRQVLRPSVQAGQTRRPVPSVAVAPVTSCTKGDIGTRHAVGRRRPATPGTDVGLPGHKEPVPPPPDKVEGRGTGQTRVGLRTEMALPMVPVVVGVVGVLVTVVSPRLARLGEGRGQGRVGQAPPTTVPVPQVALTRPADLETPAVGRRLAPPQAPVPVVVGRHVLPGPGRPGTRPGLGALGLATRAPGAETIPRLALAGETQPVARRLGLRRGTPGVEEGLLGRLDAVVVRPVAPRRDTPVVALVTPAVPEAATLARPLDVLGLGPPRPV